VKGWPTFVPDFDQCALLADVRAQVGELNNLSVRFTTADAVRERYQQLFDEKRRKESTR
jgi:hypothetical protein